jgi:hypothetical protein
MRSLVAILFGFILLGCSKKSDPSPPDAVNLVFPGQNSECTTGIDKTDTTSEVEFSWQSSNNTETYELRVTHMLTNVVKTATTTGTSAALTIDKGSPYSWQVLSRNTQTQTTASSASWQFYNAGSQTNYAPFPAEILAPVSGENVSIDVNGEVTLSWSGVDIENDITGYDIYHGTVNPPTELLTSTLVGNTDLQIVAVPGSYYWKVVTKDREGNSSDSGVYSYRAF